MTCSKSSAPGDSNGLASDDANRRFAIPGELQLNEPEKSVLAVIDDEPINIDNVIAACGLPCKTCFPRSASSRCGGSFVASAATASCGITRSYFKT